jgi:glutamine cyclotransferase
VNIYPHDTQAFTQGLIYVNDFLYEGTGLYGQSSLRKVDLESGEVLRQIDISSDYFGEGIAIFENKIYQLTWLSRRGFIYTIDAFNSVGQFTYPTEGWGLTHNGDHFILSDGSSRLQFLDSQHMQLLYSITVTDENGPVSNLNELEYINGSVYANIWYSDLIVIINPENGYVTGKVDLSGLLNPEDISPGTNVLNGIAYDKENQRIFVTGKRWPKLFEIELVHVLPVM